ncbi:MAG: hypothetical protein U5K38_14885 [Woeseiaceae bacterium]|nr:hypothetical protein [Woeseiaceae bacterium]
MQELGEATVKLELVYDQLHLGTYPADFVEAEAMDFVGRHFGGREMPCAKFIVRLAVR